ncbi:MAG: rRNA pseudouridine synthase [Candidatus Kapabacteria bacterium]|nr:rRNA pseudouridine synthase [Ignavibacteriota bacterium]MCW5885506.1 rRNA pseudouridine synthase [Candidatus Kapabacteria bacterium]
MVKRKSEAKSKTKNADSKLSNAPVRINKFLADAGVASRRKIDELILEGAIKVNGQVVEEPGIKVTSSDFITVNGDPVKEIKHDIYILLNKPKNVITTTSDDFDRKTVLDIVRKHARIFPVGRLDRNTTGVLLLTNDGELAYRLTHPKFQIERTYNVKLERELSSLQGRLISEGLTLENGDETGECEVFIHPDDKTKVMITIKEGKNREVRRIFEHFGYEVKQLDRKIFAGLTCKGLGKGEYRHLTRQEELAIKRLTGML